MFQIALALSVVFLQQKAAMGGVQLSAKCPSKMSGDWTTRCAWMVNDDPTSFSFVDQNGLCAELGTDLITKVVIIATQPDYDWQTPDEGPGIPHLRLSSLSFADNNKLLVNYTTCDTAFAGNPCDSGATDLSVGECTQLVGPSCCGWEYNICNNGPCSSTMNATMFLV